MARLAGEDEIRRIYQTTIDDLYGFVSRRCNGDRDLAEDVTQETWLRAVRAWHADGVPDRPLAWLTTVSRNLLANHFRRLQPEPLHEDVTESVAGDPIDDADTRRALVSRALARLPIPQLRLLEAFHFKRQRVADIAAEHGLSERAVEGRLRRARQQLRHQIESDPDAEGDIQ
ncbi:MAG: sigma-70 family RNA polymerase sigma factor [Gemmatimonadota bacterium]